MRRRKMPKTTKSKKDIAFDKERSKLRTEINSLKSLLAQRDKQLVELQEIIHQKDAELAEAKDWIERLLEYTEMSKEDMQKILTSEKDKAEIQERLKTSLGILSLLGGGFQ
jgi:hypothetical protein